MHKNGNNELDASQIKRQTLIEAQVHIQVETKGASKIS